MDNMEKELWDAFYGKESKQERCSVLTEADLNKHKKDMLKEGFMSDEDIHNQFSKFEVLDFSKEGEHSGYIELYFPNADEVDYDSSVITGYTIYEDGKVAFDNWFPDDVYNEVAEYVKQHHFEELDEGCGKKKKKALKENMEYNVPEDIVVAYMTGDTIGDDNFPPSMMRIQKICYDKLGTADTSNVMLLMVDNDKNKWAVIPRDKRSMVKIKKKALKEDVDAAPYSTAITNALYTGDLDKEEIASEFINYFSEDELEDVCNILNIKVDDKYINSPSKYGDTLSDMIFNMTINVNALVNEFIQYASDDQCKDILNSLDLLDEFDFLNEGCGKKKKRKALKEDYEEDEELTPVDADSLDVDEFYNGYVMDNAALWDEDIDYDAMEANKNQIFQFWKQLVKGGEDEWDAVEISVRRFASNEELNEGCGKKKKKALKESDDLWSQIQNYKKKYGNPYEESRPTSNGVDDEIKKILNKYNQEYNFLYNNHDKVAGYEEAVRAWDEYINHPDFRELIGKVIKARHDMFTSDREIGALMFALDALGYLDKFDGKESSLEPVVKEFKMNEGKSAKFYKIKCPQFNHLTKINKLAGEGDELASYYMKHRNDEFYSSKEAKEELKRYKNTSFKTYLTVEEA